LSVKTVFLIHKYVACNLVITQVYPEGTHLMIPWFERPVIYDVRARPYLVESTSGSRDLQMVLCFYSSHFQSFCFVNLVNVKSFASTS